MTTTVNIHIGTLNHEAAALIQRLVQPSAPAVVTRSAVPRIGDHWDEQGGRNMGLVRAVPGKPEYFLILPTDAKAERAGLEWGGYGDEEPGAQCEFDGLSNTQALLATGRAHPLVEWTKGFELDGRADFYVPSRRELRQCWANGDEHFNTDGWYWSSTQSSRDLAWVQLFATGDQYGYDKDVKCRGRLVRRFIPSVL